MTDTAPWEIRSHDLEDEAALARLSKVIYTLAETLRVCSILLLPYIPARAGEALERLGVLPERRTFEHAVRGADNWYGGSFRGPEHRGPLESLFPPLESSEFPEEAGEPLVEARAARKPAGERIAAMRGRRNATHARWRAKRLKAEGRSERDIMREGRRVGRRAEMSGWMVGREDGLEDGWEDGREDGRE